MGNAGAVNITLGVVTTDFVANMKAASSTVAQFRNNFASAFTGLGGALNAPQGAFNALNRSMIVTQKQMRDILAVGGKVPVELTAKYKVLKGSIDQINGAFRETKAQTNPLAGMMGGLGGNLLAAGAGAVTLSAAFGLVKKGLTVTSDFQRLDAALRAVTSSEADFLSTQTFLRTVADEYGLSIQALAGAYKGLKAASNGTALEGAATEKIFIAVTKASAALQLTSEQTSGALLALQQMMSKGTVSAEELRGQLGERIPGAFKLFADAAGVSEQKLGKMLQAGEIAATDILPKFAEQLEKVYGDKAAANAATMAGGFTRMTDQLSMFVAEFGQTAGIDKFFASLTNNLANTLALLREVNRLGKLGDLFSAKGPDALRQAETNRKFDQKTTAFKNLSPAARLREFQNVQRGTTETTFQMANTRDKTKLADLQQEFFLAYRLMDAYKKINAEKRRDERVEINKQLAPAVATFDQLESKLKGLKASYLDLKTAGKSGEANKVLAEYNTLKKQIDAIESPFDSAKGKKKDTWAQRMRKDLTAVDGMIKEFQAKNPTLEVPFFLKLQKGWLQDNLKIDDKTSLDSFKSMKTTLTRELEALGKDLQKLAQDSWGKYFEVGADGVKKMTVPLDQLQQTLEANAKKLENMAFAKGSFTNVDANREGQNILAGMKADVNRTAESGSLGEAVAGMFDTDAMQKAFDQGELSLSQLEGLSANMKTVIGGFTSGLKAIGGEALTGIFEALGGALGGNTKAFSNFGKGILNMIADLAIQIGKAMILLAAPMLFSGLLTAEGVKNLAVGGALTAAGATIKALGSKEAPGFAMGGIFRGENTIRVGEYGSAPFNPEVVSPLKSLTGLMQPLIASSVKKSMMEVSPLNSLNSALRPMMRPQFNPAGNASRVSMNVEISVSGEARVSNDAIYIGIERAKKANKELR